MANSEHILNIVAKLNTSEIKQQLNQLNKSRSANSSSGTNATGNQQQTKGLDASFSNRLNTSLNTLNSTLNRLNNSLNRLNIGQNTQRFGQQNLNTTRFDGSSAFLASGISTSVLSRNIRKSNNSLIRSFSERFNREIRKNIEDFGFEAYLYDNDTRFGRARKAYNVYSPNNLKSLYYEQPYMMRKWTGDLMTFANFDQRESLRNVLKTHPYDLTNSALRDVQRVAVNAVHPRIGFPVEMQRISNNTLNAERQLENQKRQNLDKRQKIANKEAQTEQKRSTNIQKSESSSGGKFNTFVGALGAFALSEGIQSASAIFGERANFYRAAGDIKKANQSIMIQKMAGSVGSWTTAGATTGGMMLGLPGMLIGGAIGAAGGAGAGYVESEFQIGAETQTRFTQTLQAATQAAQNFENKLLAIEFEKEVKKLFSDIDTAVLNASKGEFNLTALNAANKQNLDIKKSAQEDLQIEEAILKDHKKKLEELEKQRQEYVEIYGANSEMFMQGLQTELEETAEIIKVAQSNFDKALIKFKRAEILEKTLTQGFTLYDKTTESMKSQYDDTFLTADAKRESSKYVQNIINRKDLDAIDKLYSKTQTDLISNKDSYQDLLDKLYEIQKSPIKSVEEYTKIFNQTRKVQQEIIEGESLSETLFNAKKQIRLTELNDNLTKQQERLANLVAPDLTNVQSLANIGANMGEKNDNVERQLNFWRNSLTLQEEIKEILNEIKETENSAQYA